MNSRNNGMYCIISTELKYPFFSTKPVDMETIYLQKEHKNKISNVTNLDRIYNLRKNREEVSFLKYYISMIFITFKNITNKTEHVLLHFFCVVISYL